MKRYYIYYRANDQKNYFVFAFRNCKRPQTTKEYKRLRDWMAIGTVDAIGWCTEDYYEDHQYKFINKLQPGNSIWLQSKVFNY